MIVLTDIEEIIAQTLICAAKNKTTVSFAKIMEDARTGRRYLGKYLSHIGQKCLEKNLPVITVLAVYSDSGRVGRGYTEFEPNFEKDESLAEAEKERVWANDDWSSLSADIRESDCVWSNGKGREVERQEVTTKVPVRDMALRNACLKEKGRVCIICGFDGSKVYGKNFNNVIEVHHKNPVSNGVRVTTTEDLIPVCPNCHRALHSRQGEPYTVEDLEAIVKKNKRSRRSESDRK